MLLQSDKVGQDHRKENAWLRTAADGVAESEAEQLDDAREVVRGFGANQKPKEEL